LKLYGLFEISGEILVKTGLHIGGGKEGYEIGELDNPVIKLVEMKGSEIRKLLSDDSSNSSSDDKFSNDETYSIPYIPGSSLKGKMRSMLEWAYGLVGGYLQQNSDKLSVSIVDLVKYEQKIKHPIATVFGLSATEAKSKKRSSWTPGPTRFYVFDAYPTSEALKQFVEGTDSEFTEIKWENTIDRLTSAATPRQMERVPAGFTFSFKMRYFVYNDREFKSDPVKSIIYRLPCLAKNKEPSVYYPIELVFQGMKLVEESGLGGSVTRGYGDIKFKNLKVFWKSRENILNGDSGIFLSDENGIHKVPTQITSVAMKIVDWIKKFDC